MATKDRTPSSLLNLERQMANKMFINDPKPSIKPQSRNPITQADIEPPKTSKHRSPDFIFATPKPQGIAMGTFASQSKKSDIFGASDESAKASRKYIPHSSSEDYIPTVSLKKSEYQPPARNPITQDNIPNYAPVIRTKCSESTAFDHVHDQLNEEHRPRNNI